MTVTVRSIFKAVGNGGFQLSLEDLEHTVISKSVVTVNVQNIVAQAWELVHVFYQKKSALASAVQNHFFV